MSDFFRGPSPFAALPQYGARAILADPPWKFENYSAKGERKGAQASYSCMPLDEIQALPVLDLANPAGCVLIMWATAPMLPQAIDTMACWGFKFVSAGAWAKQGSIGTKWSFGTGYWYRSAAEFWLLGRIGKPHSRCRSIRNLIAAPVREHSRKPAEMRAMIERQFAGPYLELFAREPSPGWMTWGNETQKFGLDAA